MLSICHLESLSTDTCYLDSPVQGGLYITTLSYVNVCYIITHKVVREFYEVLTVLRMSHNRIVIQNWISRN